MLPIPYELRKHKHSELAAQQSSFWTIRTHPAIFTSCQARLRSSPSERSLAIASQVRQSFLPHKSAEFWLKQEYMNKKQAMFLKKIFLWPDLNFALTLLFPHKNWPIPSFAHDKFSLLQSWPPPWALALFVWWGQSQCRTANELNLSQN